MTDDLGWHDVGFNGNEMIKTPNLDQSGQPGDHSGTILFRITSLLTHQSQCFNG
jgi:hypothetical protein